MILVKLIISIFLFLNIGHLMGQCSVQEFAFQPGEKLTYEVAYNWGVLWVNAGIVSFNTSLTEHEGNFVYYFDAVGSSYKYYDWIYRVRDRYQSKLDPESFQPVWFQRIINEGGFEIFNQYDFDISRGQIISLVSHSDGPIKLDTLALEACRFDVLSAVYYARNINFNLYHTGDKIPIKFMIENEFYELYIRYLGKEIIKNRSGKKYQCHKISALLVEGTIFKAGEDLVVWITDDQNKIPVIAEAKILIGSVKAYLTGYEGLKYRINEELGESGEK